MDFTQIKCKENTRYNPTYFEKLITEDSPGFMEYFDDLVEESDFEKVFLYHNKKFIDTIYNRIRKIEKTFPNRKYEIEYLCTEILNFNLDENNKNQIKQNLKCHFYAFDYAYKKVTNEIIEKLKTLKCEEYYKDDIICCNMKLLNRLMYDVLELLPSYEYICGLNLGQQVSVNRHISGNDIEWFYDLYIHGKLDQSNQVYYTTFAFLIRQAIEIKTKNALGIIAVIYNKKPVPITSDRFLGFLLKNPSITTPDIKKALLDKIFKWCNFHIHVGINLYSWQSILIQEYIRPLFYGGETSSIDGGNKTSIYGAIKIQKDYYKNKMKDDLIDYLRKQNCDVDDIIMQESPECLLVD